MGEQKNFKYLPKPPLRRKFIVDRGILSILQYREFWKAWELIAVKNGACQLQKEDYENYDYFIGMDERNRENMRRILGGDPNGKISLLGDYTDHPHPIADPWYSGEFQACYEDILEGCRGLWEQIKEK